MRLRNKGVPSLRNKQVRGDHYVTLVVQVPANMTQEQKDLLLQFDKAMYGGKEENSTPEEEKTEGKKKKIHFGKNK